jgi:hypothetical protein
MNSSGKLSLRALARALGISPGAAHKRKQRGMPTHSVEAARAWEVEHLDPARQKGVGLSVGGVDASADEPRDDDDEPSGLDGLAYRRARAERERINVQRAQLELDEARGALIPLDMAERVVFTAFRTLRDRVLAVPVRVRDRCAVETDPMRVEVLIAEELNAVMAAFDLSKVLQEEDEDDEP